METRRIKTRRLTILSQEDSQADILVDEEIPEDEENEAGCSYSKEKRSKMSAGDEDEFIRIVLAHFDEIEKKSTNKSLTPVAFRDSQQEVWKNISKEVAEKTNVTNKVRLVVT